MRTVFNFVVFAAALLGLAYVAIEHSDRSDETMQKELERQAQQLREQAEDLRDAGLETAGDVGEQANARIESLLAESRRLQARADDAARSLQSRGEKAVQRTEKRRRSVADWFDDAADGAKKGVDDLRDWMRARRRDWFGD
ncbi:MAG: hypothetical protein GC160_02090 [Acidobacteria bacterium]|nr:hypothetical protein [Acidobacteriota bacterium]